MREVKVLLCVVAWLRADASHRHLAAAVTRADRVQLPELAFLQDPRINDQVLIRSVRKPITSP